MGRATHRHEGRLERLLGDGVMVPFNDPVPCEASEERAVRLARAMLGEVRALSASWRSRGFRLGCGIGIARGEATLGTIGFEGRSDYAAIGSVANLAARLCAEAASGEILVSAAIAEAIGDRIPLRVLGDLTLKGFAAPVPAFAVAPPA